jgi:hypothetical protein
MLIVLLNSFCIQASEYQFSIVVSLTCTLLLNAAMQSLQPNNIRTLPLIDL